MPRTPTLQADIDRILAEELDPTLAELVGKWRREGRSWSWISMTIGFMTDGTTASVTTLIEWFPKWNKPVHELANTDSEA